MPRILHIARMGAAASARLASAKRDRFAAATANGPLESQFESDPFFASAKKWAACPDCLQAGPTCASRKWSIFRLRRKIGAADSVPSLVARGQRLRFALRRKWTIRSAERVGPANSRLLSGVERLAPPSPTGNGKCACPPPASLPCATLPRRLEKVRPALRRLCRRGGRRGSALPGWNVGRSGA